MTSIMKPIHALILTAAALLLPSCDSKPTMRETLPADAAAELNELIETVLPSLGGKGNSLANALFGKGAVEDMLDELGETYGELLEDYDETGDARLKSDPDAITPLHVAVMFRREALVRELLKQGADPNAMQRTSEELLKSNPALPAEMDPPLCWAVVSQWGVDKELTPESTIRLIDMLVAAGADARGDAGGHALNMCTVGVGDEAVYLHLLELGADPMRGYSSIKGQEAMELVLNRGWRRAAERLKAAGLLQVDARRETGSSARYDEDGNLEAEWKRMETPLHRKVKEYVLHEDYVDDEQGRERARKLVTAIGLDGLADAAEEAGKDEEERYAEPMLQETIALLLDLGADVNAPHEASSTEGDILTPLLAALEKLPPADAPQERIEARGWLLLQLLQHGGTLDTRFPQSGGYGGYGERAGRSAAELIRAHTALAAWLEAQGVHLSPPEKNE